MQYATLNILTNSGIGISCSLSSSKIIILSSDCLISLMINVSLLNIFKSLLFLRAMIGIPEHNLTSCEFGSYSSALSSSGLIFLRLTSSSILILFISILFLFVKEIFLSVVLLLKSDFLIFFMFSGRSMLNNVASERRHLINCILFPSQSSWSAKESL